MNIVWLVIGLLASTLVFLMGLRWSDYSSDKTVWKDLASRAARSGRVYHPDLVKNLPEPAQRYFNYSIRPGTPIITAVEVEMNGQLGLGTIDKPDYKTMTARQILALPQGFVWRVTVSALSGSDVATEQMSWSRFWLFGLIPVVRAGNNPDHHRSAIGRLVSESAFWVPASLLPSGYVRWESAGSDTARAIVSCGEYTQAVDLSVADNGQLERVIIQRWSNENPEKEFVEQPFGGYLSDFRDFGGYRLPCKVEGGNLIGTDQYFPFYKAKVIDIRLLDEQHGQT